MIDTTEIAKLREIIKITKSRNDNPISIHSDRLERLLNTLDHREKLIDTLQAQRDEAQRKYNQVVGDV